MSYTVRSLDASTWDAFAELVERNNGVYGGCWCIGFHSNFGRDNREMKRDRVFTDRAHAALVFDADGLAQGWCQFGTPDELSRIKHRREYDKAPPPVPDWRITCIYVDRKHRGQGVAHAALDGAITAIARAGGGRTEAITEVTAGRQAQDRFLFSGTAELFDQYGFHRVRQVGKHAWIVTRTIKPA